jgi:hypothetical protein
MKTGFIFIAAKGHENSDTFSNIIGVIGHEFTHYAAELIYQNGARPYRSTDKENMKRFKRIYRNLKTYCATKETDWIINVVFEYPEHLWSCEMIVRVSHLIAVYRNDDQKLNEIRNSYCKELFDFFNEVTMKDLETQIDLISSREATEEYNQLDGALSKIQSSEFQVALIMLDEYKKLVNSESKIVLSNSPKLTMSLIYQLLFEKHGGNVKSEHLFVTHESIINPDKFKEVQTIHESKTNPSLIVRLTMCALLGGTVPIFHRLSRVPLTKKFVPNFHKKRR